MASRCWTGTPAWKSLHHVSVVRKTYELKVEIVAGKENAGNLLGLTMHPSFRWFLLHFVLGRGLRISGHEINCLAWPSWVVSLTPANQVLYAHLGKLACVADETRLQHRLGKKFTCLLLIEITRSKASVLLQSACSRLFYQYDHRQTTLCVRGLI